MKDNLIKVLFSSAMLALTFWGAGADLLFPNLSRIANSPLTEKRIAPVGVKTVIKNKIYIPNRAALLAGEEVSVATLVFPRSAEKPPIVLQARVYLVSDLKSEDNIAVENLNKRWPIASLSKLMVAIIALENIPKNQLITVSALAVATEGAAGGFSPGEMLTTDDLLKALLTVSSNDATMALAEYLGEEKFVSLMNLKTASLGMSDTFFKEPTGLSVLNQSTAHDLKILARYVYENHPDIFHYAQAKTADIFDAARGVKRTLININQFAGRPDFLGGKTGYTGDAGENLISLFSAGNKTIIIIVMDALDRFDETLSALKQLSHL